MYASIPVSDRAAPPPSFLAGPLLAICCLVLVLFAIACTIVIALIPVYLPTKDTSPSDACELLYFVLTPDGDLGENGPLDAQTTQNIADAISKSLNYPEGTVVLESAEVILTADARRRRKRNLKRIVRQTSARRQKIISQGRVTRRASLICRSLPSRFSLTAEIVFRGTLRVFTFLVEVSKDPNSLPSPSTDSSTVSTTTSTSTTTSEPVTSNIVE